MKKLVVLLLLLVFTACKEDCLRVQLVRDGTITVVCGNIRGYMVGDTVWLVADGYSPWELAPSMPGVGESLAVTDRHRFAKAVVIQYLPAGNLPTQ